MILASCGQVSHVYLPLNLLEGSLSSLPQSTHGPLLQVLEVLFQYIGAEPAEDGGPRSHTFCLVEKWRKIERPLQHASKVILSSDWLRDAILTSDWSRCCGCGPPGARTRPR